MSNNKKGDKLNFFKVRIFVHQKTLSREQKDKLQNERKYLRIKYLIKKIVSVILKEYWQLNNKTIQWKTKDRTWVSFPKKIHKWPVRTEQNLCVCVCVCVCVCARVCLCAQLCPTPRILAHQAPLSVEFSRQEYWSGLPFPLPENLPNPGIKPVSLASPALAGGFFLLEPLGKPSGQKKIWPSFIQREMQAKSTMRYHLISTRIMMIMIIIYNTNNNDK